MNNISSNQPQNQSVVGGVDGNSIINKNSVGSLASMFERMQQPEMSQGAVASQPVLVPEFNKEMRQIGDSQVKFGEPKLTLGQNLRVQVVKSGQFVFDEEAGSELQSQTVKDIKAARTSPEKFEGTVGAYGKSVVGIGKSDAKEEMKRASLDRSDEFYSKKETEMVERGITRRFNGNDEGGFNTVIAKGQIKPGSISAEILADLEVNNKVPETISDIPELLEYLDHEIDSYPNHMLSDIPQDDLKGMSQRQAVKDLTHRLVDLYIKAYPDKSLKDAYLLARDAARVITYQTHYDLGHWSGSSHSIKHILHNIESAESMMNGIKDDHLTDKDRFLVNLVHIYHDIGYTVPMAQHTSNWPSASSDHPLTGGKFLEANEEYFTDLIGEAGYITLRDCVFLHSHFNSDFDTATFNTKVSSHRVVTDSQIHPGIVRSVTSGSDCCAVSSDIKLQEFWMNPSVIMNTGRLQFAFQTMMKKYVAQKLADELSNLTPEKLQNLPLTDFTSKTASEIEKMSDGEKGQLRTTENYMKQVRAKAMKAAKGHIKFSVLVDPEKIRPEGVKLSNFDSPATLIEHLNTDGFKQKLEAKIEAAAHELASSEKAILSEEQYKELLTTFASVKIQLLKDAWAISLKAAEKSGVSDAKEKQALAESRFKSLVKAIDRNFNIMSVQKAFGQYGAKFQGIKVEERNHKVSIYSMVSHWVPSRAVEHLRQTNSAAFAAWQKLGDELGVDEDEIGLYMNAYMNYREAKDQVKALDHKVEQQEHPSDSDLRAAQEAKEKAASLKQEFVDLKVSLNQGNAGSGVKFESGHGRLIIEGPKGKMVIDTKEPGDDNEVVKAFTNVINAVSDAAVRDQLLEIQAFGKSLESKPGVDASYVVQGLVDEGLGNLLSMIPKLPENQQVPLMDFVGATQLGLLQAVQSDNYNQKLIEVGRSIGNINFNTDAYITNGIQSQD